MQPHSYLSLNGIRTIMADDAPELDNELSRQLKEELIKRSDSPDEPIDSFNDDLYAHLSRRPEYETSNIYKNLRKRVDVDDPLYNELKLRREEVKNAPKPNPSQSPGDVIEVVLRSLRDMDWPSEAYGLELLMEYR